MDDPDSDVGDSESGNANNRLITGLGKKKNTGIRCFITFFL